MSGDELRPAYRTLNEPSRLFGLSIATIAAGAVAAGLGYGWLLVSPLPWRANVSIAVIGLGAPLVLLVVRESSALSPRRLLWAVIRWRARPADVVPPGASVRRGAVRLDTPPTATRPASPAVELPWVTDQGDRS